MGFIKRSALLILSVAVVISAVSCGQKKARYVFLFIGDGMGASHVALAEAYQAHQKGYVGMEPVCFSGFPVMGEATNYSANRAITCSSAAGTALSTGFKTNNGMLCVAPDSTELTSISYKIHNAGYGVGILSTVQINHATPACFYGHSVKRSDYYSIGSELPQTGFEFFAGGGFIDPRGKGDTATVSLYQKAQEGGYTVAYGYDDFQGKKSADRIVLVQHEDSDAICSYALGRKEGALTLPQMMTAAVEVLERNKKGFFVMAEGGLIDWTAHGKDAAGTIMEILDMDEAVKVAYAFYEKHPDETLIIVTADHETGGFALGGGRGDYNLDYIDSVTVATTTDNVNEYMSDKTSLADINEKANLGWTSFSHTGCPVPVWAIGAGSEKFAARQDNTDIPRKICDAMGIEF